MIKLITSTLLIFGLSGCAILENAKILNTFDSSPLMSKLNRDGLQSKKSTIVAIQKPDKVTAYGSQSECLDFTLISDGKNQEVYAAFNASNRLTAYGYTTCKDAIDTKVIK
jgi:hypothetical protein